MNYLVTYMLEREDIRTRKGILKNQEIKQILFTDRHPTEWEIIMHIHNEFNQLGYATIDKAGIKGVVIICVWHIGFESPNFPLTIHFDNEKHN